MTRDISRRMVLGGSAGSLAIAGCSALTSVAQASTSDPSLPANGDSRYAVTHYAVGDTVLTSPTSDARLYGSTTMTCRASTTLTSVDVDLALTVTAASVNGRPVAVNRTSWRQVQLSGFRVTSGSTFTITVAYDDQPNRRCRTAYHNGVWESGSYLTFSGQPDSAIYWFASNDRLDNKATYDFSISTQASNQILGYRSSPSYYRWTPAGSRTPMINTHLVINEPSSTYHPGLSVGPYATSQGVWQVAGVTVPYIVAGAGSIPTALSRDTPRALNYFASQYGRYPYSVAGGVAVTGLPVGAQENLGCCSYKTTLVANSYAGAGAFVAHENAHMWFGNSVTAAHWNDVLLLQEGVAVLLENDYVQRFGGRSTYSPVLSSAKANYGPTALAQNAPYNSAYAVQRELRRVMDGSVVQANAPRHTAFLKDLATTYRHSSISRAQFKELAQRHSATNLSGFWSTYAV